MLKKIALVLLTVAAMESARGADLSPGSLVSSIVLFDGVQTFYNDTPTVVDTQQGLVLAWAAGAGPQDPAIAIWSSRMDGSSWSPPTKLLSGFDAKTQVQYPCRNPVLFLPSYGQLLLFYRVGPRPEAVEAWMATSADRGVSWMRPKKMPRGKFGPSKNKPVELADGTLLCGSSTEDAGWRVFMERARPFRGRFEWYRSKALNYPLVYRAIQPTILYHSEESIQILCRTKQGFLTQSWSTDQGETWAEMSRTTLPNPNAPIDTVKLQDGRFLLVYNHSTSSTHVLNVAVSEDGKSWLAALELERQADQRFTAPSVVLGSDGKVHVVYTWNRSQLKHAVIDPDLLKPVEMVGGHWPIINVERSLELVE